MPHKLTVADWQAVDETAQKFIRECESAVCDDMVFSSFRQLSTIRGVVENKNTDHHMDAHTTPARIAAPWIFERMDTVRKNDHVGGPPFIAKTPDGKYEMSPTTAGYVFTLSMIDFLFGSALNGLRIAEIGAGYGGLARLILALYKPASYTLYDLPQVVALQKKYLSVFGYDDVDARSELGVTEGPFDLVISTSAFLELNLPAMQEYGVRMLPYCKQGFIMGWRTRHAKDDVPQDRKAIREWLNATTGANVRLGGEHAEFSSIFRYKRDHFPNNVWFWEGRNASEPTG